jgi:membrane protease YdiL (CAAX protease family)
MTDLAPDAHEAPAAAPCPPAVGAAPPPMSRARAILQVLLCSSYPTQLLVAGALAAVGIPGLTPDGGLNASFVIAVSLGDAALVVALIVWFMHRSGESVRATFLAARPPAREAALGVVLVPVVLLGVSVVVLAVRALAPSLHNVPANPMGALMRDPALAATFAVVVVLAGGVREELQRGFQLHRLTSHVCGPVAALVLTSLAFGVGHTLQGYDVAVATGVLGAFWGVLYFRRRTIVAAAVSHGLFNLGQVLVAVAVGEPGGP